jgi:acyl-coenzyme A synthetase/AMP-(fatty) acid ligase
VFPGYVDPAHDIGTLGADGWLTTGDLGYLTKDERLVLTGREKDLIIRGGHNIDPAEIEEAMMSHPAVAFAGAIGQPDAFAGELPCVYVELVKGADVTEAELMEHARSHIRERAAIPKHVEVLAELPKTGVGKIFKPDLRKRAITRVYNEALAAAGFAANVATVTEDKKRGLVAHLRRLGDVDDAALAAKMGEFTTPWDWAK